MIYPWLLDRYHQLLNQFKTGQLHHATLVHSAGQQLGKAQLVEALAKRLLCQNEQDFACGQCKSCQLLAANSHSDFVQLRPQGSLSVEQIRQLVATSQQKSQHSGVQVFIIEQAEKMTESAANALLKTLEEPGQQKYFLLTTGAPSRLLATIKSRCQLYSVTPPEPEQLNPWLATQGVSQEQFYAVFPQFSSSPLEAVQLIESGENEKRQQLLSEFKRFLAGQSSALQFALLYDEKLIHAQLDWLLSALQLWLKKQSANKTQAQSERLSIKICQMQNCLIQVKMQILNSGVNKKMLFQAACVQMSNLLRG